MSHHDESMPPIPPEGTTLGERRSARHVANRAFMAIKAQRASERTAIDEVVDKLNDFASSTPFLIFHVVWFMIWLPWNAGAFARLGLRPFDPYPFGFLTMVVSLEAIFLSIFVLLAQKRESAIAELREEMSLQVALWTEQEVTKSLQLLTGLYRRLGHPLAEDADLKQMLGPLDVHGMESRLVAEIERTAKRSALTNDGPSIEKERHPRRSTPASSPPAGSPPPPEQ